MYSMGSAARIVRIDILFFSFPRNNAARSGYIRALLCSFFIFISDAHRIGFRVSADFQKVNFYRWAGIRACE